MEILNPSEWARLKNTSIENAHTIIKDMRKHNNLSEFPRPLLPQHTRFSQPITLESKKFNTLLGKGFTPGKIYLLYGAYATGKTQIGFHACVSLFNIYKAVKTPVSALFIDTEDTFRPERIHEIGEHAYLLKNSALFSRIRVLKATSTTMIFTLLKKIDSEGLDTQIKLIVIDSLTKHIRLDLGNEDISNIQIRDKLKRILGFLHEIAHTYNIPIILTSQVTGFTTEDSVFTERPIMEYVLNYYVDEIIYLNRIEEQRWAYLVNSGSYPNQQIPFKITAAGIVD